MILLTSSRISSKISHPVVVEVVVWAEATMAVEEIEGEVAAEVVGGEEVAGEVKDWLLGKYTTCCQLRTLSPSQPSDLTL